MSYIGERRGTENRAEPDLQSHTRVTEGDRSRSPTPGKDSTTQGKIQTNMFSRNILYKSKYRISSYSFRP